ncbi:MAG: tRNA preQ1(34) S-adenosylmethionine ribosyltransferase-isomerase QueA [Clostridiales bacterium]|nr:tRNA preQ1(34) S-adenosylmethionine ribosyltransferase-isomerase QueA [Clostridiales bacterium]
MHIDEFDYHLPEELIAQEPEAKRDFSRLMVLDRKTGNIEHKRFYDILDYLNENDCLVMNNSKVIPARLFGVKRTTGAKLEFLLIKRTGEEDVWEVIARPAKRLKPGDVVDFSSGDTRLEAEIVGSGEDGIIYARFSYDGIFLERLEEIGETPLPPYIQRKSTNEDKDRYQTVYSSKEGSVAAPTAGLHFTEELLEKVRAKGVKIAFVTLHVGIGTFRPVQCTNIEDHKMHFEEYVISQEAAEIINQTKKSGGRVVCIGTTSVRTVESAVKPDKVGGYVIEPEDGSTGIFIYPGFEFKMVDSLITNFHLPKSTLMMLISALYNKDDILRAYGVAVAERYRFFSYGDAMLIL